MIVIKTITILGIEVINIEVQIHFAKGQPGLTIVGLGDKAINESRERIRAVLNSLGISLPANRITVNLAPADLIKEGTHFDLPIALGILSSMNIINSSFLKSYVVMGELSLNGDVRTVNGILPASIYAEMNDLGIICPYGNKNEAIWGIEKEKILAIENITSLINHINNKNYINFIDDNDINIDAKFDVDISDVIGQEDAKKALLVAACGNHNILMIGSPGTGKSMLASRLPTILPPLDSKEMIETSMIKSVAGILKGNITNLRPFRNPHHSASMAAILGGGKVIKPGEVTLAHNGVLFLDELPEYPRYVIESMRQVIEERSIIISRVSQKIQYPARFQLIAAMNPCQCGYAGIKEKECGSMPKCSLNYQKKVSGPIMDRIDMMIDMKYQKYNLHEYNIAKKDNKMNSDNLKSIVLKVRKIQSERYEDFKYKTNSDLNEQGVREFCLPQKEEDLTFLSNIADKYHLSMRAISKVLKVARTISEHQKRIKCK